MTKSQLRRKFLQKRSELTDVEAAAMSGRIAERFFGEVEFHGIKSLHTFIRIRRFNEIDTSMIYFRLWRDHPEIKVFAPRVDAETGELMSVGFGAETEFTENSWGIREPVGDPADPAGIDLVIVPLLCFDLSGHRVGYGKGYYDRFLARCRPDCVKIGLSLFPPVDDIEDLHDGDVPVDLCITPDAAFRFSSSAADA